MKSFEGKVALISGASSGIELALAEALAARGAAVAITVAHRTALAEASDIALAEVQPLGSAPP